MSRRFLLVGSVGLLLASGCGAGHSSRRPKVDTDGGDAGIRDSGAGGHGGAAGGSGDGGGAGAAGAGGQGGGSGGAGGIDASVDGSAAVDSGVVDAGPPLVCGAGLGDCDGIRSNGCETSLTGNVDHCLQCSRSCTAAGSTSCGQHGCGPTAMFSGLSFGTDNAGARTWAFGNGAMFHLGFNSYTLERYPMDGSAASTVWPVTVAAKTAGTESLVVYGTDLLWAERGTPSTILRKSQTAPTATLPTVFFTPEAQPQFMRIQGNYLYWTTGDYQAGGTVADTGYVYRRALDAQAGDPETKLVTTSQGVHGAMIDFAVTTDRLYWVTGDTTDGVAFELRTAPIAGGPKDAVPGGAITEAYPNLLAVLRPVGDTLYFSRNVGNTFTNGIYSYKVGDAAPTQLVSVEDVTSFLVDTDYFYITARNSGGILRAPRAGGAVEQITDGNFTELIGMDATSLYANASACCTTVIDRISK